MNMTDFSSLRYGMFVHFGLYSLLGRGEWVMNRERIPREEYRKLAEQFNPEKFDADALCSLAAEWGMRYLTFTTMHHEGFCLYHSDLTDFHIGNTPYKKDMVAEVVDAARRHGLKIALYHSLNNWMDLPDGSDALESPEKRKVFVDRTFERFSELVEKFKPFDILWYDGWWPFHADGWRAEEMNALMRKLHPGIILSGRNGLPGDFATPEGHMTIPSPWRPWEACMTFNDSWGYNSGDHNWKTPSQVVRMLSRASSGMGNLLLNIGPRGDGSIPEPSLEILKTVSGWVKHNAEAVYDVEPFTFDYMSREGHRSDWNHSGTYTAKDNRLYLWLFRHPGSEVALGGIEVPVKEASVVGGGSLRVNQTGDRLILSDVPPARVDGLPHVLRMDCEAPPSVYLTGGMRVPKVPHPPYDPCASDIKD